MYIICSDYNLEERRNFILRLKVISLNIKLLEKRQKELDFDLSGEEEEERCTSQASNALYAIACVMWQIITALI